MAEEKYNDLCRDCFHFKRFKDKCWFYWKEKKECTQKIEEGEEENFVSPIEDRLNK